MPGKPRPRQSGSCATPHTQHAAELGFTLQFLCPPIPLSAGSLCTCISLTNHTSQSAEPVRCSSQALRSCPHAVRDCPHSETERVPFWRRGQPFGLPSAPQGRDTSGPWHNWPLGSWGTGPMSDVPGCPQCSQPPNTEDVVSATARMPPMEPYRYRNSVSQVLGARHGTKGCTCICSFYLHGSSARWVLLFPHPTDAGMGPQGEK